ncbi:terminase small subunit [Lysinibacillus sp. LZ02]|uniref:terminase small subunit n=1 Tax=Lysinibacillus sp. LZ02 TaxID=3420668 RepID=UPI003D364DCA
MKVDYSKKTVRSIGQENLTKPDIKAYIDERMEQIKSERMADQQEVGKLLMAVMHR